MRPIRLRVGVLAGAALSLTVVGGCGSVGGESTASSSTTSGSASAEADVVEGMFDVGGHKLFMRCAGTGSPTVIYLHGSIEDTQTVAHNAATGFQDLLAPDYRTCVYDRRNVGDSETVDAVQLPSDALGDLDGLLDAAEIAPPYVLVGASFGGMLAYLYANEHADDVVGMVLLDATFPDELSLDYLFPPGDTYKAFSKADETTGLERISHFKVLTAGQQFIGKEPAIPVTYLASTQEGYEDNDYGIPEYNEKILDLQAAYIDRFSPGRRVEVDAPHYMEPVIPEQIADEVRQVVAESAN